MSHDEIIAVVMAHQEGKKIQTRSHFHPVEWQNCNPVWDFYQNDYRVAPESRKARVFIVNVYSDGSVSSTWARRDCPLEQIKVLEIID